MLGRRIPVVLCFDVEPDLFTFDPNDPCPWRGFEALTEIVPKLRAALERATDQPVRFNWAVRSDPQVARAYGSPSYAFRHYASFFQHALRAGDAIGVHPHAWRWDGVAGWVSDHADQAWIEECLETAVSSYAGEFGEAPTFHRYGAQFMTTATMNRVRDLGVKIDLTVEPGACPHPPGPYLGGHLLGGTGDCRRAPRVPYHPDTHDFCHAAEVGCEDLWAIPLTVGHVYREQPPERPAPRPLPLKRRVGIWVRDPLGTCRRAYRRAASSLARPARDEAVVAEEATLQIGSAWPSPGDFWLEAVASARRASPRHPYLAFATRSDDFINPGKRRTFESRIAYITSGSVPARLAFVRPDDIVGRRWAGVRAARAARIGLPSRAESHREN